MHTTNYTTLKTKAGIQKPSRWIAHHYAIAFTIAKPYPTSPGCMIIVSLGVIGTTGIGLVTPGLDKLFWSTSLHISTILKTFSM